MINNSKKKKKKKKEKKRREEHYLAKLTAIESFILQKVGRHALKVLAYGRNDICEITMICKVQ